MRSISIEFEAPSFGYYLDQLGICVISLVSLVLQKKLEVSSRLMISDGVKEHGSSANNRRVALTELSLWPEFSRDGFSDDCSRTNESACLWVA